MLLREMWSPIGSPKEDDENVDWIDDLKFFIDNDDTMLNQYFFPAVKKHKEHAGNPNAYKIYVRPIEKCLGHYCDKFKIDAPEGKFPKEKLIDLAKKIATEQEKFLERGDYENK